YDALAPFKRLLDVWISEYFGIKGAKHITQEHAGAIVDDNYSKLGKEDKQAIATALAIAESKRFFHWELEFPEVFYDAEKHKVSGGFDAVVGNPPYGSQSNDADKAYLSSRLATVDKRAESYIAFVEIAHNQARKQAFVSLIVPDTWLTLDFTRILREHLLSSVNILQILDLPNNVFSEATVDTTILVTQKLFDFGVNKNILSNQTNISRFLAKSEINSLDEADISSNVNQLDWSLEPGCRFTIEISNDEQGILGKLRQDSSKLDEICSINYGLKAYQEGKGKPSQTRQDVNLKAFSSNRQIDKTFLPFFEGEDIARFAIDWQSNNWLKYGKHLAEPRNFALFTGERLLYRKIVGKTLIGTVVVDDALSNTLLYVIKSKKGFISVKFVASILNSSLFGFFFRKVFCINSQETFPQIMLDDLKLLPIHHIPFITPTNERAHLLEKAKNLYNYCLTKNDQVCILGFVDHHLSQQPEQSDVVHDLLAFLAEEMIRLNKEKRAIQKEFLDWLVTTLNVLPDKEGRQEIDVLTNKAKLADYPGDYQKNEPSLTTEELLDILRKNKNHLGVSLSDANLVDRIKKTYEESLQRVLPLKERLARTDRLIDQVVYRLYGLTEDEIKVVEGKGS
ncbi:MAG TPA: TaqI-like C-terminal specificity domain-containing protein, partial [Methylomirabilota bacterium]|nr:TaqI-like C-terminal specificity domain-containing protein [Methylomirabilota bacterium]